MVYKNPVHTFYLCYKPLRPGPGQGEKLEQKFKIRVVLNQYLEIRGSLI